MLSKTLVSDKPLKDPSFDNLGYAPFASILAESICEMMPTDGLVMALYGPWGSGKSTIVEFILNFLEKKKQEERPIIIRFNPWWFSNQEDLTRHFFKQLTKELSSRSEVIRDNVASLFREFADLIGEAPIPGAKKVSEKAVGKLTSVQNRSITEFKDKISKTLEESKHRILIVIDDIDRLDAEEIRQIFRMVKAVGDFSNIIYLLAFDRAVVSKALSSFYSDDFGDRFIDKIVQVSFEIPAINRSDLRNMFLQGIESIVGEVPIRLFNKQDLLAEAHLPYLLHFLKTPRDVFRVLNTLRVTYPAVKGEVDAADFITIEALRVFEPKIYQQIWEHQDTLTNLVSNSLVGPWGTGDLPENVRILINKLFPAISDSHQREINLTGPEKRKNLLVCSPDVFGIYFRFSLSTSRMSHVKMETIITAGRRGNSLDEFFIDPNQTRYFFDRFGDYLDALEPEEGKNFINNFLRFGDIYLDLLEQVSTPSVKEEAKSKLISSIVELIHKISREERYEFLRTVVLEAEAYSLALDTILLIGKIHGTFGGTGDTYKGPSVLSKNDVSTLKDLMQQKIQMSLEKISFSDKRFPTILDIWLFIEPDSAKSWIYNRTSDYSELIRFLDAFIRLDASNNCIITGNVYNFYTKADLQERVISPFRIDDGRTLEHGVRQLAEKIYTCLSNTN